MFERVLNIPCFLPDENDGSLERSNIKWFKVWLKAFEHHNHIMRKWIISNKQCSCSALRYIFLVIQISYFCWFKKLCDEFKNYETWNVKLIVWNTWLSRCEFKNYETWNVKLIVWNTWLSRCLKISHLSCFYVISR